MDPVLNPYAPGSGSRPPAMVGREPQEQGMAVLIRRVASRLHGRPMVRSGLRGVGKTVLLNSLRQQATATGWVTVALEASPAEGDRTAARQRFARALTIAARSAGGRSGLLKKAAGSIGSISVTLGQPGVSVGITPQQGRADSRVLDIDLVEMAEDIADDLKGRGVGFAIFVDELQDLDAELTAALLTAQHQANQNEWPFFVIGAGLPNLPARLSGIRSYTERMFSYQEIGPLPADLAAQALTLPAADLNVELTAEAVDLLVAASNGYPYFLQEFGKAVWDLAADSPFTAEDARAAIVEGHRALDEGFFPARWERATRAERDYLAAMIADGDGGSGTGRLSDRLGKPASSLGPVRARLISKGLIFAPEYGVVRFTVPGMADFIRRQES